MHHVTVKSSNIESVAYDPATRELHVRFKNGGTYSYEDVPAEKHAALMAAPPRSCAARLEKSPWKAPMGVRAAPTMTIESDMIFSLQKKSDRSQPQLTFT